VEALYKEYCLDSMSTKNLKLVRYAKRATLSISINVAPYVAGKTVGTPILIDRVDLCINGDKYIEGHRVAS